MSYIIKDYAYRNHDFEEKAISDKVTGIGLEAFAYCKNLRRIVIPENVTKIGSKAFMGCSALENVVLKGDFKSIGGGAFAQCENLKKLDCNANTLYQFLASFKTVRKQIMIIYDYLSGVWSCTAVPEEKTIQLIKRRKNELVELIIQNDNESAAAMCLKIIDDIDKGYLLELAQKSDAVKVSAVLVDASKQDKRNAIEEMQIENVDKKRTAAEWKKIFSTRNTKEKNETAIIKYKADAVNVVFPEKIGTKTIVGIDSFTFENKKDIVSVIMPDTIRFLGYSVFANCKSLEKVILSKSLKSIGGFSGCTKLMMIDIPEGVERIEWEAFDGCSALQDIYIPSSVISIGENKYEDDSIEMSFRGCFNLVIHTPTGSYAEQYAKKWGIKINIIEAV